MSLPTDKGEEPKKVGLVAYILFPDRPKYDQHFALCIEPCMQRISRAPQGGFVELRHFIGLFGAQSRHVALMAHGFQRPSSRTVQAVIGQRFSCTVTFHHPESAIPPEALLRGKPVWVLNQCTEHMSPHNANARHPLV